MTFTLTKKHLIAAILITLFLVFSITWFFQPDYAWLFISADIIVVIIAAILWFSNKEEAAVKKQKFLEKQDQQLVKKLFHFFMQELKDRGQLKRKYKMPWYLFISHDLSADESTLAQMGFRACAAAAISKKLPVQIWLKNDAVILCVEMSSQDYRALNCLKLLLKQTIGFRSRQTLNGIMTSQSVDYLISNNKSASLQVANDCRLVINEVQKLCGQSLPIYVLFNQMAGLADFCQFFASLDEAKLDGAFGSLNTNKRQSGKFQTTWFEQAYDNICQSMGKAVLTALDSQLSEGFRRSAVAAPMQFKQIKGELTYYLEQLFINKNTNSDYHFRGFFFTNSEQKTNATDPLTKQVAYQLGFNEMRVSDTVKLSHSIFVNPLFDSFIRPESGLASINKNRKRLFWSFQISYSLAILTLITSVALLLKVNFDYYQPLNASTVVKLNNYKAAVRKTPYDLEELAGNITNLEQVRAIYLEYIKATPFYISNLVPNPALTSSVTQAYHNELIDVLLPSMVHYLEDELFVYETLSDTLKTAKLLNLNEELQQHDNESWQHLKLYYQRSFIKEGHSESETLKSLMSLMDDLYTLGVPKVKLNENLISQARASLNSINTTKVLFNYIEDLPQFSTKVDISSELGNNFEQVYKFAKGYSGKLVPYLYTPQGFASIDLSSSSDLMKDLVHNNKALLGHQLNSFEVSNLAKNLQRYYQRNYINYWLTFTSKITLKPINLNNLGHNLALLTLKADAPMAQLYQALAYYTYPTLAKAPTEKNDKTKLQAGVDKLTSLVNPDSDKIAMAKSIQSEFMHYHNFVKQDDKGNSELSSLQDNYTAVALWLSTANKTNNQGSYLFEQVSGKSPDHSLYQLSQTKVGIAQIDLHITRITALIDSSINSSIKQHINQQWQQQITSSFNRFFANKFPFDLSSNNDVDFKAFNRFFKVDGQFSQFKQKVLDKFTLQNNQLQLTSFNRNSSITIDTEAYKQILSILAIQQTLFQQSPDQFKIDYKIKTFSMSASLLNVELFTERSIFNYQHGPKLWSSFTWPDLASENNLLVIFTDTANQKNTLTFEGPWAWLRLIYKYHQDNLNQSQIKITLEKNAVTLTIDVEGDTNPLVPSFFSKVTLPEELL